MIDDLESQYERLQALLAGTERTLQRVVTLHDKQRACVERLASQDARMPEAHGILAEMAKTVQILRWQKAWLRSAGTLPVAAGEVGLNGWIKITRTGDVRLAMHRSEMGQGVHTALAMLVAE